jgi:hypothetical protein
MHSLNRQLQAVVAGVVLIVGSGCATSPHAETPVLWHSSGFHTAMPVQCFQSYEAVFQYIAKCENLRTDSQTLFALAADSTIERWHNDPTGDVAIIRAEYYGDSRFGIRGAQGNGRYYAFQTDGPINLCII